LPLHTRRRAIEAVLDEILGLHNKPKAAVHSVHKLTGHKKKKKKKKKKRRRRREEEEEEEEKEEKKKRRRRRRRREKEEKKKKKLYRYGITTGKKILHRRTKHGPRPTAPHWA